MLFSTFSMGLGMWFFQLLLHLDRSNYFCGKHGDVNVGMGTFLVWEGNMIFFNFFSTGVGEWGCDLSRFAEKMIRSIFQGRSAGVDYLFL